MNRNAKKRGNDGENGCGVPPQWVDGVFLRMRKED
jgi:hypothetical protein